MSDERAGLDSLPPDIFVEIVRLLNVHDILAIRRVRYNLV